MAGALTGSPAPLPHAFLVAVDDSDDSEHAFAFAMQNLFDVGRHSLHILHVMPSREEVGLHPRRLPMLADVSSNDGSCLLTAACCACFLASICG